MSQVPRAESSNGPFKILIPCLLKIFLFASIKFANILQKFCHSGLQKSHMEKKSRSYTWKLKEIAFSSFPHIKKYIPPSNSKYKEVLKHI